MLVLERLLPFLAALLVLGFLVLAVQWSVAKNTVAGQIRQMNKLANKQLAKADHASKMGRTMLAEEYLAVYHETRQKAKELEQHNK
jgi:SNF family Na+-dependent transporter